jgi:hypothetical protein
MQIHSSIDAVKTYRYLRLGVVGAVLWLFLSIAETSVATRCVQVSLSAYFYTTSHAVFVGSLCAIGLMLIAYQGRIPAEEILVDFSGFLAITIAIIPIVPSPQFDPEEQHACGLSLPTSADGAVGSVNNLSSLLVTSAVIIVIYWIFKLREPHLLVTKDAVVDPCKPRNGVAHLAGFVLGPGQVIASSLAVLYLVAGIIWFISAPDQFRLYAHDLAALGFFAGIVLVSIFYACYAALEGKAEAKLYGIISLLLTVTLIILIILDETNIATPHAFLLSEIVLIVEFASFWLVQTYALWHVGNYRTMRKAIHSVS